MKPVQLLLAATIASVLSGCAVLQKADAPVTMRLSPGFSPTLPDLPGSIAVAQVQARGITGALRYAYIDPDAPGEIHQAATLFWEESPTRVLERALITGLRTRFATVTGPAIGVLPERRVVTTLTRFEEVGAGRSARAVISFDATVVMSGKRVESGSFCGSAAIDSAAPTVRAQAFERAISAAVSGLVQRIAGSPAGAVSTC